MPLEKTVSAPISTAGLVALESNPSFKIISARAENEFEKPTVAQSLQAKAGGFAFNGTFETPESATAFGGWIAYVHASKASQSNNDAENIGKRARTVIEPTCLEGLASGAIESSHANPGAAVNLGASDSNIKTSAVLRPIEDFRECRSLLEEIDHCQYIPLAKHTFDRIIEALQADRQTGKLSHLSLQLVKTLIKSQAENIPQARSSSDQRVMSAQLRTLALESLKVTGTNKTSKPMSFETMSLMVAMLNNLRALDRHASDVVLHTISEVTHQLGETLLAWLPRSNDRHYQSQIFDALALSAHVLPHSAQARLLQLAVGDEQGSKQLGVNNQALLLSSLIRNERGPIIEAKLEIRASFIALLDKAVNHLEQGHDTTSANLLSTLDSTFLQLTPRDEVSIQSAEFSMLKARFLEVRAQALQQLSPFASASVHGRLLTLGRNLPLSDMLPALSAHFEPAHLV